MPPRVKYSEVAHLLPSGLVEPPARRAKYRAVPCTYAGLVYDSQMEAAHARALDLDRDAGRVRWWLRQVTVYLGDHLTKTRIDFLVYRRDGTVVGHEIKGHETPTFQQIKQKWREYGPFPLEIVYRDRVETIVPKAMENQG
jgi:hypothetical protein